MSEAAISPTAFSALTWRQRPSTMVLCFRTPQFASLGGFASLMARALASRPSRFPGFSGFFCLLVPAEAGKLLRPDPREPMRWILTRRRRLPLALAVVLACAPPSVMPSRLLMIRGRRCGCQGASSLSPRIRSNHDAVTANVTNMGPTEQAGLIYDCL